MVKNEHDAIRKMARSEKIILKALVNESRTIEGLAKEFEHSLSTAKRSHQPQQQYFLLSMKFLEQWRDWVKNPTVYARPELVDNSDLICQHDKVCYDINESRAIGALCDRPRLWKWQDPVAEADGEQLYHHPALPILPNLKLYGTPYIPYTFVTKEEWTGLVRQYGTAQVLN